MRELEKHDIRCKCFQINQTDLREFIASTSSQDLRDLLENYEPMMVTIHTLQGVEDGQIQTVSTRFHDWSSTAIKINCKKTMDKCRNLFQVNGIIFVLYRWIAGQLEIGIGLPGQQLPD
uniref:Uncharacterized protein n=1 Tax=Rhizophora mucronata TaxID=61149 RepID=A0A2P2QB95_RHIMU